jgi:hypothetical protein
VVTKAPEANSVRTSTGALIGGDLPGAVDGLDERSPDRGIEFRRGLCQCGFRHAQGFGAHSVEAFGEVLHRGRSPAGDGVEQLGHPSFDIGMGLGGPRQLLRQESLIEGLTTEVQNVHRTILVSTAIPLAPGPQCGRPQTLKQREPSSALRSP